MGKEERGMRIGRCAAEFGLKARTLRYYESLGLLRPARTAAGYRVYRAGELERVRFILRAKRVGLSLRDIAEVLRLREAGQAPCDHVARWIARKTADLEEQLRGLHALRRELTRLRRRDAGKGRARACACPILEGTGRRERGARPEEPSGRRDRGSQESRSDFGVTRARHADRNSAGSAANTWCQAVGRAKRSG